MQTNDGLPVESSIILGAGFSKCADLPMQSEFASMLVSDAFQTDLDRAITSVIRTFLSDIFGWRSGGGFPSLEDIFTCIDLSSATGHHLSIRYSPKCLRALRRMLIYRIFSILDSRFRHSPDIEALIRHFLVSPASTAFIVLNWDIVLERHITNWNNSMEVDYCCHSYSWNNRSRALQQDRVRICKMHGSSNWVYCENCKSLFYDVGFKLPLRHKVGLLKSDFRLFDQRFTDSTFDNALGVHPRERQCPFCDNMVASHIATFSYRKSFRTAAYPSIWSKAERLLSQSRRWVFIGYSLPEADYEFKHILKVAQLELQHKTANTKRTIEIVYKGSQQTRSKYEAFFGSKLIFHQNGLEDFVQSLGRNSQIA